MLIKHLQTTGLTTCHTCAPCPSIKQTWTYPSNTEGCSHLWSKILLAGTLMGRSLLLLTPVNRSTLSPPPHTHINKGTDSQERSHQKSAMRRNENLWLLTYDPMIFPLQNIPKALFSKKVVLCGGRVDGHIGEIPESKNSRKGTMYANHRFPFNCRSGMSSWLGHTSGHGSGFQPSLTHKGEKASSFPPPRVIHCSQRPAEPWATTPVISLPLGPKPVGSPLFP